MRFFSFLSILILIVSSCSLTAKQERSLNKNLGLYVQAIQSRSILVEASMTHPSFLKHIKSKGDDYFTNFFQNNAEEEELVFFDPCINRIESQEETIHVMYSIKKEYIFEGVNREDSTLFIAISEDDGENWFFVRRGMYFNEKICKEVPRLLK